LNSILSKKTGKTLKKIATDTDRDFFMNSEQAKSYGIVDSILKKR
jgi:ATP-dependent Clp protease protease subunit